MSSRRFPGKVLAPFRGQPIIARLLEHVSRVLPLSRIVVLTSSEPSDDPLAGYVRGLGVDVYRGELHNVAARFHDCLRVYPCSWFVRLCGDSPLLDAAVLQTVIAHPRQEQFDLITNVYPRTFPKGHSVEMVRGEAFAALDPWTLSVDEQEHVTTVFYRHPQQFRILNVTSCDPRQAELSFVVDTVEDLRRLESMPSEREAVVEEVR